MKDASGEGNGRGHGDPPTTRDASAEKLAVTLVSHLREGGLIVAPDATVTFVTALAEVGVESIRGVYWAGRATLVHRPEDIAEFDRAFATTFGPGPARTDAGASTALQPTTVPAVLTVAVDDPELAADRGAGHELLFGPVAELRWADREVLRAKDFAACNADELDEVNRLVAALRVSTPTRPSRRHRPTRRPRGLLDLRATARQSLGTGGEAVRTRHRSRGTRPRRLVLLCDVSGSMETYTRPLVRFAHAAVLGQGPVEVFTLGTRCTRITRSLRTHDPDAALASAASTVEDWSSGTRLGQGLRSFNDTWGQRGMARGAVVVVISDGWDRGDPELLAAQTARLQRAAHRLVWVNPFKAAPGFTPTAQGMAAALPFVDDFIEGHSFESLEALAGVIAR